VQDKNMCEQNKRVCAQDKKRIVFMGTPEFAAIILEILLESHEIAAVYSRPDAVSKRGKVASPSPVSQLAGERNIPLFRPLSLRDKQVQKELAELKPDIIIVAAYGMLLPREVLDIPPYGCVNVHASLLPRWRGAAPIERAILAGDERTGVSIMQMEEGLDTGPYCALEFTEIAQKSAPELHAELAQMGGRLLLDLMPTLLNAKAQWTAQDEAEVSYAHKIEKSELRLSPDLSATDFVRRVRASSESAPARLNIDGRGAAVLKAELATDIAARAVCSGELKQGEVRLVKYQGKRHVLAGCADTSVELFMLKPDGKKAMPASDWLNGFSAASEGLTWD